MIPDQFNHWKDRHNHLVRKFTKSQGGDTRDEDEHEKNNNPQGLSFGARFEELLVSLQSMAPRIMLRRVELSVGHSLLIVNMLGGQGGDRETGMKKVVNSLIRLVDSLDPAVPRKRGTGLLGEQVVWVLDQLCDESLLFQLNSPKKTATLRSLSNTISLLVLQLVQDSGHSKDRFTIMDKFLKMANLTLKIYRERTEIVGYRDFDTQVENLDVTNITKYVSGDSDDMLETVLVTRIIQVIRNSDIEDLALDKSELRDTFYANLLRAVIYRKRKDVKNLYKELNHLEYNQVHQPPQLSVAALLLKAETLLDLSSSPQLALTMYSQVLRLDPGNVTALVGTAFCFQASGMENSELDAWNLVMKLLHCGQVGKPKEDLTFIDIVLGLLVPQVSLTLLDAATILAKKCLALGKYCDAADKYLDVLSMKEGRVRPRKEGWHPWQAKIASPSDQVVLHEAALALLLAGRCSLAIEVCQKAVVEWSRARSERGKRKLEAESYKMFEDDLVSYFLHSKASFELGQLDVSLEMLDKCFRTCGLRISPAENREAKVMKLEEDAAGEGSGRQRVLWNRLLVIRARLYYEKAMVFKGMGDRASFIGCLKASLLLHPCAETSQQYGEALEQGGCRKEIEAVKKSIVGREGGDLDLDLANIDDLGLKYLLDDKSASIETIQLEKTLEEPMSL